MWIRASLGRISPQKVKCGVMNEMRVIRRLGLRQPLGKRRGAKGESERSLDCATRRPNYGCGGEVGRSARDDRGGRDESVKPAPAANLAMCFFLYRRS